MALTPTRDEPVRQVYSVSRLNREARFVLNECLGRLWIEGEISNLATPASGHLYFTLKDSEAQVRCAMFRPQARLVACRPKNGDHVLIRAEVGLFEPRGDFQLIVEHLELAGDGALLRAFEELKRRLAAEGLFEARRKRAIPPLPRCVGVITSPSGAAVHDILTVLARRFPAIPVIVFPARVQGAGAGADIVRAIARADRLGLCDVLLLARGGGSLEDLWCFNEEIVARAIAACGTPIVTGIGHEIDFTIADFAADRRAPTPSAAAEAVSPNAADWLERFRDLERRLARGWRQRLDEAGRRLGFLAIRLDRQHPSQRLRNQSQRLDELELRLRRAAQTGLVIRESRLHARFARLLRQRPESRLDRLRDRRSELTRRLRAALERQLMARKSAIAALGQELHAVSPLATLTRGYSITTRLADGSLVRDPADTPPGTRIATRLMAGRLVSVVEEVETTESAHSP